MKNINQLFIITQEGLKANKTSYNYITYETTPATDIGK
jgi:hypothetical protein